MNRMHYLALAIYAALFGLKAKPNGRWKALKLPKTPTEALWIRLGQTFVAQQ